MKILVVDDDERLLNLICELLTLNGYQSKIATNVDDAKKLVEQENFDALIIDWMMPNETGIDFIKFIRNHIKKSIKSLPTIMLTALGEIEHKTIGFESGFDDYLTKPFEPQELILRLVALFRRSQKKQDDKILLFGDCEFNLHTWILINIKTNLFINLTSTELSLLKILASNPNQPFTRMQLAKGLGGYVSERTVDVQINRLRKKLDDTQQNVIRSQRHIGYFLSVKYLTNP